MASIVSDFKPNEKKHTKIKRKREKLMYQLVILA